MKRRRGFSLIELLVVISILSVLLGLLGTLIHRLVRAERVSARAALVEITAARLADQFRRDAHAALAAKSDEPADLQLQLGHVSGKSASLVVYTAADGTVQRELIDQQRTVARETWRMPGCRMTFSVPGILPPADGVSTPAIVTLLIRRPSASINTPVQTPPLYELPIDAELGRDLRRVDIRPDTNSPEESK